MTLFVFINEQAVGILLEGGKAQFSDQSLDPVLSRPKPRRPEVEGSFMVAVASGLRENSTAKLMARLDELEGPVQSPKLTRYRETGQSPTNNQRFGVNHRRAPISVKNASGRLIIAFMLLSSLLPPNSNYL
jgi:hypothetical protein